MNKRQKIMVLVLVVLMGIGGYYHRKKVLPYLDPVLQIAGINVSAESTPEITPTFLVKQAEKNLQQTLRNSFNLPETAEKKNIAGFTGEGRLSVNFPEGMQVFEKSSRLETKLKLDVYDTESFKIDFALLSPPEVDLPEVTLQKSEDHQVLLYPGNNEYYPIEADITDHTPESAGEDWQLDQDLLEETTRGKREVYRLEYEMDEQPAMEVFITRKEPHMFVGVRGLEEKFEGRFQLEYEESNESSLFKSISFRGPGGQGENKEEGIQFKLQRVDFDFTYSGGTIENMVLKQPGEDSSSPPRQINFNFSHQNGISQGAKVSVKEPGTGNTLEVGEISWQFENGWPQQTKLDFQIPLGLKPINLQFALENMNWHEGKREFDSAPPEGYKRIEFQQLAKKYQPFTKKMGFFQAGEMPTPGGDTQVTVETDSEVETAEDTAGRTPASRPEPGAEDTSTASQPESTSSRRAKEEVEPETGPETESDPAPETEPEPQPAAESEQEAETERAEQQEAESEIKSVSSVDADQVASPENTESETEDEEAQFKAGPDQSGEEIHYSTIGRFPMSNPPQDFEVAREYFSKGEFRQAEEKLNKLAKKYPNSANVNYMLGVINFESSRFEKAITYFKKGSKLEHDPQLQAWSRKYLDRIDNKLENEEKAEEK